MQPGPDGCHLSTRGTTATAAVWAGNSTGPTEQPGSVIVAADFIPGSNTSGDSELFMRAGAQAGFLVDLAASGEYLVQEQAGSGAPHALLQGNFNTDQTVAPQLNVTVVNRLVVSIKGGSAEAYINGRLIGAGSTAVPDQPGGIYFAEGSVDASPTVATLLHLYIFRA